MGAAGDSVNAHLEGQDLAGGALKGDGLAVQDHGLDALTHQAGYDGRYVGVLARVVLAVPAAAKLHRQPPLPFTAPIAILSCDGEMIGHQSLVIE